LKKKIKSRIAPDCVALGRKQTTELAGKNTPRMNQFNQDPDINNGSPVVPTGYSIFNAKVDPHELHKRRIGAGLEAQRVLNLYERELVFIRVGRLPNHDPHVDLPCAYVFATFNGIDLATARESEFRFAGLARNSPEHMNRNGVVNAHFAVFADGGNTIVCRSKLPISPGSYLKWRIPRGPGVPVDEKNLGRVLPEIVAHNPADTQLTSLVVHQTLHRLAAKKEIHPEDTEQAQVASAAWVKVRAIAYLAHLAYVEATTGQPLTNAQKLTAATVFGIVKADGDPLKEQRDRMQKLMPDRVFQMSFNATGNKSSTDENMRPFKLDRTHAGATLGAKETQIARECADPFGGLVTICMKQLEEDMRDVIGYTNSGGYPGQNMDVVLRRI
jgi:hypothetical protein